MHSERDYSGGVSHPDQIEMPPEWLAAVHRAVTSAKWYPGAIPLDRMIWFLARLEWNPSTSHSIDVMAGRRSLFVRLRIHPRELDITIRWRGDLHQCFRRINGKADADSLLINPCVDELRQEVLWLDPQYLKLVEVE